MTELRRPGGAVLLDTDAFSFLHRGGDRADDLRPVVEGQIPLLSFVSVGELERGALQTAGARRDELLCKLASMR